LLELPEARSDQLSTLNVRGIRYNKSGS